MIITHLHKSPVHRFLALFCLLTVLAAVALRLGYAQTSSAPTVSTAPRFPRGATVYVDINAQIRGTEQGRQINNAFANLNYDNRNRNNSGINYVIVSSATAIPQGAYSLHVYNDIITGPNGTPSLTAASVINPVRFSGQTLIQAQIIFNVDYATTNGFPGSPKVFNSTQQGYTSFFQKLTEHEVLHGQGLDHPPLTSQQAGASIMNELAGCVNDNCNFLPPAHTNLDNSVVNTMKSSQNS